MTRMVSPECTHLVSLCHDGKLSQLSSALQDPSTIETALRTEGELMNETTGTTWDRLNLTRMIEAAALGAHLGIIETLLQFGQRHDVPVRKMVNMDTMSAALRTEKSLEILKIFQTVDPDVFRRHVHHGTELLSVACGGGMYGRPSLELARYLLQLGIHPDGRYTRVEGQSTNLTCAVSMHSLEMVDALLKHGATISGSNTMCSVSFHGRIEMLEVLVKYGGDVNEVARQGAVGGFSGTPLHVAAAAGKVDVAMWLLEHGADVSIEDELGRTAKQVLEEKGILRPFNTD